MPKSTGKKKNLTISCHFDGQYSGSKIRKYPKKKSGWPVPLSFNAKRHGSNEYKILKLVRVFSNVIASLIISHVLK